MTDVESTTAMQEDAQVLVERKLRRAWHKQRRYVHIRGWAHLVIWLVVLVLLDLLIDWLFLAPYRAPGWARLALVLINVVALIAVVWHSWLRDLHGYDRVRTALQVEGRHPELKSLLISYVQFDDDLLAETDASPVLAAAARRQALAATRPMDFREIVNLHDLRRLLVFCVCVLGFFAGLSAYKTDFFRTLFRRLLNPQAQLEYPTRTVIERVTGDLSVQQGSQATITAICSGEIPDSGTLCLRAEGGTWEKVPLLKQSGAAFAHDFPDVHQSFEYYVELGDDESERFYVDVIPAPKVFEKRIVLTYPPYTELPTKTQDSFFVEVPEGTRVRWELTCDRSLAGATLVRNRTKDVAMTVAPGGRKVIVELPADETFSYQFRWTLADHPFVYTSPAEYSVQVYPDAEPQVEILEPYQDERATVRKRLTVTFAAKDDFGLGKAELAFAVGERIYRTPLDEMAGKQGSQTVTRKVADIVGDLKEDTVVTYWIEVHDRRTGAKGPNVGASQKRRLYIVSIEEYLRGILEERLRWVTETEELRAEERQADTQVDTIKNATTQPATRPAP